MPAPTPESDVALHFANETLAIGRCLLQLAGTGGLGWFVMWYLKTAYARVRTSRDKYQGTYLVARTDSSEPFDLIRAQDDVGYEAEPGGITKIWNRQGQPKLPED